MGKVNRKRDKKRERKQEIEEVSAAPDQTNKSKFNNILLSMIVQGYIRY
jgi:hypothetical protein